MIVLDTDILIEIFDKNSALGEEILGKIEGYEIATTSINLHEIVSLRVSFTELNNFLLIVKYINLSFKDKLRNVGYKKVFILYALTIIYFRVSDAEILLRCVMNRKILIGRNKEQDRIPTRSEKAMKVKSE